MIPKNKLLFFLVLILVHFASFIHSKSYYVALNGKGNGKGTLKDPFTKIAKAVRVLKPGDTCFVRGGSYEEVIVFNVSGQKGKKIVLKNYENEKVVILPKKAPNRWEHFKDEIYRVKVKDSVIQLFFHQKSLMQASFPSVSEGDVRASSWGRLDAHPDKSVVFNGAKRFSNLSGAHLVGVCGRGLVALNGTVKTQIGDKLSIENNAWYWAKQYENAYLGKGKGFLVGKLDFLDTPGEWFYSNGFLYFWPPNKTDFKHHVRIRTLKKALVLSNQSFIEVDGIQVVGGTISLINSRFCSLRNSSCEFGVPFFKFEQGFDRFSPNTEGGFNDPVTWSGNGCEISGYGNKVLNCYFGKNWGDGLTVWGTHNVIENVLVRDCDWMAIDCAPMNITGSHHKVQKSTFCRSARSVISFRKLIHSKFILNEVYLGGLLNDDLGLFYCYDSDGKGTEIAYNWVHDNLAPYFGPGIYLDNGNANYNVHHNVVWNCFVGINVNTPSKNVKIWNNTIIKNQFNMGCWPLTTPLINVHTYNNLTDSDRKSYLWNPFYGTKIDSNVIQTNIYKTLLNPRMRRFDCYNDSLIRGKGLKTIANSLNSDIGAYPYKGYYWIPGVELSKWNNNLELDFTGNEKYQSSSIWVELVKSIIAIFLIFRFLLKVSFVRATNWSSRKILVLFSVRLVAGFALYAVYNWYYLNREVADVFKNYDFAKLLYDHLFWVDRTNFFKICFGQINANSQIQDILLRHDVLFKRSDFYIFSSNQLLIRMNALLMVLTGGSYIVHSLVFITLSFIGSIGMYRFTKSIFEISEWKLVLAFFFTPSFIFWSSGIMRDSLLVFLIGMGLFLLWNWRGKIIGYTFSFLLASCFLLIAYLVKNYTLFALFPAIVGLTIAQLVHKRWYVILIYFVVIVTYIWGVFFILPEFIGLNLLSELTYLQTDLKNVAIEMHANSRLFIPLINDSLGVLVSNLPIALWNVFIEPLPTKIYNFGLFFAFFENLCLLLLAVMVLFWFKKPTVKNVKGIGFSIIFVFLFASLIGEVVPIIGGIVRYRALFIPFYIVTLLSMMNDENKTIAKLSNGFIGKIVKRLR
jgi:hypothetical protein